LEFHIYFTYIDDALSNTNQVTNVVYRGVKIRIHFTFVSENMYIKRTSPCAADNNESEAFVVTDSWCCYVGIEEELHVILLCFTGFFVGIRF
jgi:hypothetical protein